MSKTSILVVENEAIVAADIVGQLGRLGYEISGQTARGDEAVALATGLRPDLVLMDIRLAGPMDGVEAADAIRRECGVPVIFLTAHSDAGTLERAKLTDPFGYILKPFEELDLRTQIEMALYRHRAERALRESEERYRTLAAATFEGIAIMEKCIILDANEQFAKMHGYEFAEVIGLPTTQFLFPEDHEPVDGAMRSGGESSGEFRHLCKDGSVIVVEAHGHPLLSMGPNIRIVTMRDITERKRANERLFELNQRLEALMNALPVGVSFSNDATCENITGNPAVLRQFAVTPEDNLSASAPDSSAPGRLVRFFRNGLPIVDSDLPLQQAVATNRVIPPMELEVELPNGRRWIAEASGAPIHDRDGKVVAGVAVTIDITERKRAEEALRVSEERLRMERERMPIGCIVYDERNCFSQVNPAAEAIFGFSEMELRGKHANAIVPESARPHVDEIVRRLAEGDMTAHSVNENVTKDGRTILCEWTNTPLRDKDGGYLGFLSMVQDVTERRQAEDALRTAHDELEQKVLERTADLQAANAALGASEERFRQMAETLRVIADNLPDGAIYRFVRDANGCGRYRYLSEGVVRLHGISASNALLTPGLLDGTVHPEDLARMREAEEESARTLAPFKVEGRIRTPSGEEKWLHWHSAPRRLEEGGTLWDGVIIDITERKAGEAALRRANRALLMLQECAKALERASTESELLRRICEIVLRIDGMKMAWVGFAGQDQQKTVRPVAQAGDSAGYLKAAKITWADEPRGRGPTGTAIRMHTVNVCYNVCSDDRIAPWRALQLQRGYAASIALPLIWEERCLGALTIYSAHPDAFNEQEVNLLTQLAGDLTYGIIALRTRAEREQLQRELLTISEREKLLISQELHDGLCQNLAGTSMMVSMLARGLAAREDRDAESAKQICTLLNTSVNEARNLSHGLHPVGPEGEGLMNALTELAGTVTNLFHIRCTFHCPEPVILENSTTSTHLFRITQEAINNARKHGEADEVRIGLTSTAEGITLTIQDNGVGIPSNLSKKRGMGLRSMGYRAAEIGATLSVRRGSSKGTVVSCILPRHKNAGLASPSA